MEKKPVLTKNSRLQLSLADLNLGVQRKIAALGAPQFFKAYEHFGRPREGMTFDSMKYGLDKFGISISAASVAALFRSVGKDTFNEEEVDRALVRGSKKGVDFRKFIKAWIKDENVNLQTLKFQQELKNKNLKNSENINYSKKILQKANLIKVSLDGVLFSILPFSEGMTSLDISNKLKSRLPRLMNEFLIVENMDKVSIPKIKDLDYEFKINQNDSINFISRTAYQKIINDYPEIKRQY